VTTTAVRPPADAYGQPSTGADERHQLVMLAQAGDSEAVAELYRVYNPQIFRFVFFRVGNRVVAQDLAQDVWVRALRHLSTYAYSGRDIGAWFITIARNLVADYYKSGRFRLEVTTGDVLDADRTDTGFGANPEADVADYLTNVELCKALNKLNEEQRECLVNRFLRGLTVAETAAAMGKNEGAIKALQYRAVRALYKHDEIRVLMETRCGA